MELGQSRVTMKLSVKAVAAMGVFALLTLAAAPSWAEGARTETVKYPNGKGTSSGFLAVPEKTGRYGAIVVAPEWWGLTDWVKEQTEKLAAEGYIVLAVDFYDGKVASDAAQAGDLSGGLTQGAAEDDLEAAVRYLGTRQDVDRGHLAAVGWGMGGGYVLRLAMRVPQLAACIVNYSPLPTDPNDVQVIFAPVLGNFGAEDHGVTPADVNAFEKVLKGLQRRVDIKIYAGAGHAFENPASGDAYRPEDAADAWSRTIAFLNKTMK
jgi:carboxymethylenebutenolidase